MKANNMKEQTDHFQERVNNLKVGDKLFNRPITKITPKCIYINPFIPWGKFRYTKEEVKEHFIFMKEHYGEN